jgi:hypothetical protein
MRGRRYGEVFVVTHDATGISAAVYNSYGLNDLPQERWQALDPDALKQQFGADAIILNGPRYWTMDMSSVEPTTAEAVVAFDGLELRQVATLLIDDPRMLGAGGRQPYQQYTVARKTVYVFSGGKSVYELVAPDGQVYVMQAYAQIVDPTLSEEQLSALAARLQLPEHWHYRTRTLDWELELRADGVAHIIQDELQNTYQRNDN